MPRSLVRRRNRYKYEYLRNVDVVDFLEHLEVANISRATADEITFSCPFPGHSHGDEKPSAYMNDGSKDKTLCTLWKCHGCGRSGNGVVFLAEFEQISLIKAGRWIQEHYAPGYRKPKGGIGHEFEQRWERHKQAPEQADIKLLDWSMYHERFGVDWHNYPEFEDEPEAQYIFGRGFTPADLEEWAIGYDSDSGRLTIPVCDPASNLIGIKGRAWRPDQTPKYRILGDTPRSIRERGVIYGFEPYEKSRVVFGIHMWGAQPTYVFCEGEIDVMSFWRIGIPALCTGGVSMSDAQARLIRRYADQVVLFFDNDKAGSHGLRGYDGADGEHHPGAIELLEPFVRVRIVKPHMVDANVLMRTGRHDRLRALVHEATSSLIAA